jgi:SPP1 family predicted phage head-tail adaptor
VNAIGRLRHRLTLEAPVEMADGAGDVARTWSAQGQVWAAIEPVGANDAVVVDKRLGALSHRVTLRHRDDLTLNHRFRLGMRVFFIRALRDPDELGRFLECLVAEERP